MDEATRRELDFLSIGRSADGEACYLDESNDEVRTAGNFGSRPFIILESSEPDQAPSPEYEKEVEAFNDYRFHQLRPRLAALSTHGRLVLVENPRAPETIIAAVSDVVTQVRAVCQWSLFVFLPDMFVLALAEGPMSFGRAVARPASPSAASSRDPIRTFYNIARYHSRRFALEGMHRSTCYFCQQQLRLCLQCIWRRSAILR